ncbi:hypothetical protein PQ469_00080 [Mucilaginibacter sp. KACC 22773]|uniref:hypothetical protein n=1 Tax=Mucilaginibacter sp. KACC 22773 TaxID=3025671 RepID=UPI00236535FC|nr:hypothetical protein [Mucilaginibacter sp. KACC 22773]WDF78402.1 hypothetical protein PQ469_00080 [Mucilaginibacter sp. KACC 22773]
MHHRRYPFVATTYHHVFLPRSGLPLQHAGNLQGGTGSTYGAQIIFVIGGYKRVAPMAQAANEVQYANTTRPPNKPTP